MRAKRTLGTASVYSNSPKLPGQTNQRTVVNNFTGLPLYLPTFLNGNRNRISMFDILVYLFETYYTPQACPEADVLAHKLAAVGFEHEDINEALGWLHGLAETTEQCGQLAQNPQGDSRRVFTDHEYQTLGTQAIGFITFLENSGVLPTVLREILIERAQATNESPISLAKIKIIALMVLWSQEAEVDHLVFEELLADDQTRLSH